MVGKGRFREDLYYRINVVPIIVPPLRERGSDISLLVEHFVRLYCTANRKPAKQVQPEAMEILEHYSWPGNVRELENVVQRLVLMSDGPTITAYHIPQQVLYSSAASQEAILIPEEGVDFDGEMDRIQVAYLNAARITAMFAGSRTNRPTAVSWQTGRHAITMRAAENANLRDGLNHRATRSFLSR